MEYALIFILAIIAIAFINKVYFLEQQLHEVRAELRRLRHDLGQDEPPLLPDPASVPDAPPAGASLIPVAASNGSASVPDGGKVAAQEPSHRVFLTKDHEERAPAPELMRAQAIWLGLLAVVMVAAALTSTGALQQFSGHQSMSSAPLQSSAMLAATVALGIIASYLHRHRRRGARVRYLASALHLVIVLLLLLAFTVLTQWYLVGHNATAEMRQLTISTVWGTFAILLLGTGFWLRSSLVRVLAIGLLLLTILRTCYFYFKFMDGVVMKGTAVCVGLASLAVTYLLVSHFKDDILVAPPREPGSPRTPSNVGAGK